MTPIPMHINLRLLDRQIVDPDGRLIGKVDDLEMEVGPDGVPIITAILCGQEVLGERLGGAVGGLLRTLAHRLRTPGDPPPLRIPYHLVADVDSAVELTMRQDQLAEPGLELWLRENVIGRIPGASHASE
ncbi:MAG: hypothetical protein LLG14_18895 [Nocardiaceae bacterium]|nr:hypothetical protein [Nocardiaceae bacterium]